jgi:hypothetical protein
MRASSIGQGSLWDDDDDDKKNDDNDDKDSRNNGGIASEAYGVTEVAALSFDFIDDDKLREDVVEDLEKCAEDEEGDDFLDCVLEVVRDHDDLKYNWVKRVVELMRASDIGGERRSLRGSKL